MEVENAPEVPEGEGRLFFHLLLSPDGTHFCVPSEFASGASFKKLTLATKTISGWTSDVFCRIFLSPRHRGVEHGLSVVENELARSEPQQRAVVRQRPGVRGLRVLLGVAHR